MDCCSTYERVIAWVYFEYAYKADDNNNNLLEYEKGHVVWNIRTYITNHIQKYLG